MFKISNIAIFVKFTLRHDIDIEGISNLIVASFYNIFMPIVAKMMVHICKLDDPLGEDVTVNL